MDDENQLKLTEQLLAALAVPDTGWTGDLTPLPDAALAKIRGVLKRRLKPQEVVKVETYLIPAFGQAVEIAKAECVMRQAIEQESVGSKRTSAKLGVQLRVKLTQLIAELEDEAEADDGIICAGILKDTLLESLVTPFLEERLKCQVIDPLRKPTSEAILHLRPIIELLLYAVNQGVVTGQAKPALNFLAVSVVRTMLHASKKIHGRTWNPYTNEENGVGLAVCRILAEALQDALPEHCRLSRSPDMAKPYRNAICLTSALVGPNSGIC